jgi:hypothetical protein
MLAFEVVGVGGSRWVNAGVSVLSSVSVGVRRRLWSSDMVGGRWRVGAAVGVGR